MKLINRFYNEDRTRLKVEEILDVINKDEAKLWLGHPCTTALKSAIEADMIGILNVWIEGGYSDQLNIDSTAQKEAKARGMIQAMDDILESVQNIGRLNLINNEGNAV